MTKIELFTNTLDYINRGCGVYDIANHLNISIKLASELVLLAHDYNRITID